jgi:hypothetical protein
MDYIDEQGMCLPLPASSADEGIDFLESIAAGNLGAGARMTSQGKSIPQIRAEYKILIERFEQDLMNKKAMGLSSKELARWAVNERTRIAKLMRRKQGLEAKIILDLRDVNKYGLGGRSYDNLEKRLVAKGVAATEVHNELMKGAVKPNKAVSDAAIKGATFLKNGGRAIVVISISATAYTLLTAPEDKLEQVIYEEIGGVAGGAVGGGLGVGLCIAFGIATSGWGLLACGVVGGGAGGLLGAEAGSKVYLVKDEYMRNSTIVNNGGFEEYNPSRFMRTLP